VIRIKSRSLKWRLVFRIAVLQGIMLTLLIVLIFAVMLGTGVIPHQYEGGTMDVLVDAVTRDADGGLELKETPALSKLRATVPDLWFIIRDKDGHRLDEGTVPAEFQPFAERLDNISDARFDRQIGEAEPPDVRVRWTDTAAGNVQIMCGTKGELSVIRVLMQAPNFFVQAILPLTGLMALSTLFVTPWVVHGALRGLGDAAAAAERIDIDQRGLQLPADKVPSEILPLVKAVNDALGRLDRGYERHKRFLTDAAHELRTPVAILGTRIAALPPSPERARLLQDTARLSTLTDQLLDLQRLDRQSSTFGPVDLVDIARTVVVDLAPIAFAAGYEMDFEAETPSVMVSGDRTSIERAVMNLIQNAIEHGGNAGRISVGVSARALIEVADEGSGVPPEERERIFEPFHRLRPRSHGAGLGLNLVREIMQLHGGHIEVVGDVAKGACFRMAFRPLAA
jgi:signal transduction histidine kinase